MILHLTRIRLVARVQMTPTIAYVDRFSRQARTLIGPAFYHRRHHIRYSSDATVLIGREPARMATRTRNKLQSIAILAVSNYAEVINVYVQTTHSTSLQLSAWHMTSN